MAAGHRLAPWLAHVMVSRQETARALLTPGEVMQLPPADELVLVSGLPPIRAQKLRYYEDRTFQTRVLPAPALHDSRYCDRPAERTNDWGGSVRTFDVRLVRDAGPEPEPDEGGLQQQRHPQVREHSIVRTGEPQQHDLLGVDDDRDISADARAMSQVQATGIAARAYAINEAAGRDDLTPSL